MMAIYIHKTSVYDTSIKILCYLLICMQDMFLFFCDSIT